MVKIMDLSIFRTKNSAFWCTDRRSALLL